MEHLNPSLKVMVSPSNYSISDTIVESRLINVSQCFDERLLRATLCFFDASPSPVDYNEIATALIEFVRNHMDDSIGPFTAENSPDENTVSGVFAAHLQFLFTTRLATTEQLQLLVPSIVCCAQNKIGGGSVDVTIYKNVDHGLHVRVIWEFSVKTEKKEGQLFAYVNNCSNLVGRENDLLVLGVIVVMKRDKLPSFRLYGFVKAATSQTVDSPPTAKLAMMHIFTGDWDQLNVARLLRCIHEWANLPGKVFLQDPVKGCPRADDRRKTVVECVEGGVKYVYKSYDFRGESSTRRDAEQSVHHINGCVKVVKEGMLTILRYPFIDGTHLPANSQSVVGVISHLVELHSQGKVHMDVKAGNCVFNGENGALSRLIDFDYTGKAGQIRYPRNFNTRITDGARHADVQDDVLGQQIHDCFSLGSVLRLVAAVDTEGQSRWERLCDQVASGDLTGALVALQGENILLQERRAVDTSATGSPPEKRLRSA